MYDYLNTVHKIVHCISIIVLYSMYLCLCQCCCVTLHRDTKCHVCIHVVIVHVCEVVVTIFYHWTKYLLC